MKDPVQDVVAALAANVKEINRLLKESQELANANRIPFSVASLDIPVAPSDGTWESSDCIWDESDC